jgi:hypothetical protein
VDVASDHDAPSESDASARYTQYDQSLLGEDDNERMPAFSVRCLQDGLGPSEERRAPIRAAGLLEPSWACRAPKKSLAASRACLGR